MRHSELPIPMNKYLGPEYKIQIPYMNYPKILGKHFTICNEKYSESVYR